MKTWARPIAEDFEETRRMVGEAQSVVGLGRHFLDLFDEGADRQLVDLGYSLESVLRQLSNVWSSLEELEKRVSGPKPVQAERSTPAVTDASLVERLEALQIHILELSSTSQTLADSMCCADDDGDGLVDKHKLIDLSGAADLLRRNLDRLASEVEELSSIPCRAVEYAGARS